MLGASGASRDIHLWRKEHSGVVQSRCSSYCFTNWHFANSGSCLCVLLCGVRKEPLSIYAVDDSPEYSLFPVDVARFRIFKSLFHKIIFEKKSSRGNSVDRPFLYFNAVPDRELS